MVPLSTILEAELEQTPDAPKHGTLTERLEDANKALVVPFACVLRGTAATITGVLTHVVVWFDDDEHSKFTANINDVMVDPDVMVWGPARKQRSQLSIARREGLKRSVARRKSKPEPDDPPPGWLPILDAAAATGILLRTLRTMIADGRVPSRRVLLRGPTHRFINRIVDVEAVMRLRCHEHGKGDAS